MFITEHSFFHYISRKGGVQDDNQGFMWFFIIGAVALCNMLSEEGDR